MSESHVISCIPTPRLIPKVFGSYPCTRTPRSIHQFKLLVHEFIHLVNIASCKPTLMSKEESMHTTSCTSTPRLIANVSAAGLYPCIPTPRLIYNIEGWNRLDHYHSKASLEPSGHMLITVSVVYCNWGKTF